MKIDKKQLLIYIGILIIGGIIGLLINISTHKEINTSEHQHINTSENPKISTLWTCSMYPHIRKTEPGKCPLCGMDLIPLEAGLESENEYEIKMSPTAMQLANVQTSIVKKQKPFKEIRLNGKVQADERKTVSQTAHIGGRIEQLYLNFTGEMISKGQLIATIYSPELVSAQEELFQALKIKETNPALFQAAKEKLKNWKLSQNQIDEIIQSGRIKENFPVYADKSGIVIKKEINQGDYIKQGAVLYDVADLSSLWILFDVYESDLSFVKKGNEITYTLQSFPGEKFNGKISFIDPVINPKTRVAKARIDIQNKNSRFKPEMFASGIVQNALQNENLAIVIPKSAVLWTGKKSIVYVKTKDEQGLNFQLREVVLGTSLGENFIIKSGLEEGEEIATHGTFSIDAAAQLAGKPSMMNLVTEKEVNPDLVQEKAKTEIQNLLLIYLKLKDDLVKDDFEQAKIEIGLFKKHLSEINMQDFEGQAHKDWMLYESRFKNALKESSNWKSLDEIRSAFVEISETIISLSKNFKPNKKPIYIQHCPMANKDKGANWLSFEKEVKNPYFGESMLGCGEVKSTIK